MIDTAASPDSSPPRWHTLSAAEVSQRLEVDPNQGLSAQQVEARRHEYGLNELISASGRNRWQILLDQFTNVMLLMLMGVAIVSGILDFQAGGFPKDTLAILAIVILNALLGYFQESRAEQALAALKQMASPSVRVRREGLIREIPAPDLVPGDCVLLEAGVQIPADGRLWDEFNLQIREAALTGEAVPVIKQAQAQLDPDTALGDRCTMAYRGTEVTQGRGTLLVTSIGMSTELGRIAAMLEAVEPESTPLQRRMDQLSHTLVAGALGLVALVVIGGLLQARNFSRFQTLLETSLSMAVAVVPEGLPAVITVTLAIGMQRMVRRQALIRRLPAVETLGSVTAICSDKTGTLTENKMVVTAVETATAHYSVTGTGYVPEGSFYRQGTRVIPFHEPDLRSLLLAITLCNDAVLQQIEVTQKTNPHTPHSGSTPASTSDPNADKVWTILGDPTEGALLTLAAKAGLYKDPLDQQIKRMAEIPFSSDRKRMSVVVKIPSTSMELDLGSQWISWDLPIVPDHAENTLILWSKGSPELLLQHCDQILVGDQILPLDSTQQTQILKANDALAAQGIRVLGIAVKLLSDLPKPDQLELAEDHLIWLGLVGMRDAPRREAKEAVAKCQQAGIRPIMLTGDHHLTAIAVAQDLGIARSGEDVVLGPALNQMDPEQLQQTIQSTHVYARVAPEHKLRIVQTLQRQQQFVAMTGDGVNDAPALKQADIGIAMGITGTDVSKEASDMVLLNDNFATIVAAVEEGRIVYSNIRRFIKYILGSNVGEVLTIASAPLLGLGEVPLTPLQILWMNLVTDGLPALALALEPGEAGVMDRPPYDPNESIFARGLGVYIIRVGVIFALLTITMMLIITPEIKAWKTMVFTMLCVAQMGHAIAVRSNTRLVIEMDPKTNPALFAAVGVTIGLQMALIYFPPLQQFFGTEPLSFLELSICLGFSTLVLVWVELEKIGLRWWFRSHRV